MLAVLLCSVLVATAPPPTLEGRVVDSEGTPVKGAELTVPHQTGATRTDEEGRFVWTERPAPPFSVTVVLSNGTYLAPVLVRELPPTGPLLIVVKPLVAESVVVAGESVSPTVAPPAAASTAIGQSQIQRWHPPHLTDLIQGVPGAGRLSDFHAAVPSLRGLARGRTLLLIDGARVTTERRAGPNAAFLEPFFLESVEITRGQGWIGYGSDGFGGIIHARTRRVEPGTPTRVRIKGSLGAGLPERSTGVELTRGLERGGVVLQARHRSFASYRSPGGVIDNSQMSDHGLLGRVEHKLGPGIITGGWQTHTSRDVGRPDARGASVTTTHPEDTAHRLTIAYELEPRAGFTHIAAHGFVGTSRLITQRDRQATADQPARAERSDVTAKDFSFRARGTRVIPRGTWELGVDLHGRHGLLAANAATTFDAEGTRLTERHDQAVADARRLNTAVFAQLQQGLGSRLVARVGTRLDHITTRNVGGAFGDRATATTAGSGYAALTVRLGEAWDLTGQLSRGIRDPTLSDRYFRGPSGRGVITGNPALAPEHATQLDAALRHTRQDSRWAVFGYYYRLNDLIERFEPSPDQFRMRNGGAAEIYGVEMELQTRRGRYLFDVSTHMARGRALDDRRALADIPTADLRVALSRVLGDNKGYARVDLVVAAEDDRPGPTERRTPAYAQVDVGAGWRLSPYLELRSVVRNLFDAAYPVSPDRRAVLAPGASAALTLVGEF